LLPNPVQATQNQFSGYITLLNPLTPNDPYRERTAQLTSKRCILYIYLTDIGTEYFKHSIYFKPLTPNDPHCGRNAPLNNKFAFYKFIQQI